MEAQTHRCRARCQLGRPSVPSNAPRPSEGHSEGSFWPALPVLPRRPLGASAGPHTLGRPGVRGPIESAGGTPSLSTIVGSLLSRCPRDLLGPSPWLISYMIIVLIIFIVFLIVCTSASASAGPGNCGPRWPSRPRPGSRRRERNKVTYRKAISKGDPGCSKSLLSSG